MQKTDTVRPKECDLREWACRLEKHLTQEYRDSVCEEQDGFEDIQKKIVCQNKEGLLTNSDNFILPNMKRRAIIDTNAYMLEAARKGAKNKDIVSHKNIPSKLNREYRNNLISSGLLSYDDQTKLYKTTDLGLDYLDVYYSLRKLIAGVKDIRTNIIMDDTIKEEDDTIKEELNKYIINNKMEGRSRNTYEIYASILQVASDFVYKTSIMYAASLCYKDLQKHLSFLKSSGFIKQIGDKYKTTDEGKEFVNGVLYLFLLNNFSLQ